MGKKPFCEAINLTDANVEYRHAFKVVADLLIAGVWFQVKPEDDGTMTVLVKEPDEQYLLGSVARL